MKHPKLTVHRVVFLWKNLSNMNNYTPKKIANELSIILGYNPISITLLAQQSLDETVRSESIQAYYYLMEEEMIRNSIELSIMG